MNDKKLGLIISSEFAEQNVPPYPKPTFFSFEHPFRIKSILDYLDKKGILKNQSIEKLKPNKIEDSLLQLGHSKFYIDTIKRLSKFGGSILGEENYVTVDTYNLAKLAVGGAVKAVESVVTKEVDNSFALIRPPGHHALRENAGGLCIFNNIALSIFYLREILEYSENIAIIDIDDHFGDGLARYFYEDKKILYFSVHEFDFLDGDIGFLTEMGAGEGIGKNINFPVPSHMTDDDFLEIFDIIEPILKRFQPGLIIVAAGFDMHFSDPIGNCLLTSRSYYNFTKKIKKLADEICEGKLSFILEGGYNLLALPHCVYTMIRALLGEVYEPSILEEMDFSEYSKLHEIQKIKNNLQKRLRKYWNI